MVELSVLGAIRLRSGDRDVDTLLAQPKRLALLAYLTLARPAGSVRRDTILALFWPEHDERGARHALSQALHFLRRALGADFVVTRGADEIGIDLSRIRCDALEFERALRAGDVDAALGHYRGELLAGLFLSEAPGFERWLEAERARLHGLAVKAAHERAERAQSSGRKRDAVEWAARAVALDPLDERAVRHLMRTYDAVGDRAGALRAYQELVKRTAAELEADPSPETRALADEIRGRDEAGSLASTETAAERPVSPSAELPIVRLHPRRRRWIRLAAAGGIAVAALVGAAFAFSGSSASAADDSIVVLPFADMGAAGTDEYLADGLTEDITTLISQLEGLRVAARTSAFAYKGKGVDVREIGRALDVSLALEGSTRRDGDRLRVTAQLVSARTGYHIWSETYDRPLSDVFAVQEEIARAVASIVHLRGPRDTEGRRRSIPRSVEAYEAYLRARHLLREHGHERTLRAISFLERAIAADSSYARAHAALADAYIALAEFTVPRPILPKAKAAALRALELDSTIAETRLALGDLRLIHDRDWPGAEREYREAIRLEPRSAAAYQRYARFLAAAGRFDEHVGATRTYLDLARGQAIDAQAFAVREQVALASAYFAARQYDRAIEHCRRALELDPGHWHALAVLGRTYVELERYDDAIATLNKAWPASLRLPALARLGYAYGRAGQRDSAERILGELRARDASAYVPKDQLALVQLGLGDRDGAMTSLERALEERHWWLPWINQSPPFDVLRASPRFQRLLAELGVR